MGILDSIFKGLFKGKINQIEDTLKNDPEINRLSEKIKTQVKEVEHSINDMLITYAIAEFIIGNQPLSEHEMKIYIENKSYIDGFVELTREYQRQQEEMTKFLYDNFINKEFFSYEIFKMNVDDVSESDIETIMEDKYTDPRNMIFTGIEFLDLINNKPAQFLKMKKYREEGAFETKEVIQSAREEIEKIKAEYLKKKVG